MNTKIKSNIKSPGQSQTQSQLESELNSISEVKSNSKPKCIVLLSSGLDSSVNLFAAHEEYDVLLALTIHYGQRAAAKEIEFSKRLCEDLKISHHVLDLTWIKELGNSALLNENLSVPIGAEVSVDSLVVSQKTAQRVWVPNRNGIFLQVAAGFAESLGAKYVIVGFNAEEAATFPDNSKDFMGTTDRALFYSTQNHVEIRCFTVDMNKEHIVKLGTKLQVPWRHLWPCYFGEEQWCGTCESCQRFFRALQLNGIYDIKN